MTSAESLPLVIAPPPDGGSLVTRHRILHWKPCSGSQKIGADASGLRANFRTWDKIWACRVAKEALGHQIGTPVERAYRRMNNFERRRKG
jgi:hypothetical protein